MELLPRGKPDPSFQSLPKILWEEVRPTPLTGPRLAGLSSSCAKLLGVNEGFLRSEAGTRWLNGEERIPGDQRISTRYAGHQFGHWAGQLGDGRAISLLEFLDERGGRWEIQTKGSGLTPFSRRGDGKAVVRSSVREFLCSEAMAGLGIPTTRALALLTGEDPVQRETVEKSALLARAFPSNLRFGHFEYCAHFRQPLALRALLDYTKKYFYPGCATDLDLYREVVKRTAELIAGWMAVGFCHGVMNTDNLSILGLTIDYGPFGFLETTRLAHVCNHSDDQGRYAFGRQPAIGFWNLERLAVCFTETVPREDLIRALEEYGPLFSAAFLANFRQKLGFYEARPVDEDFIRGTLTMMEMNELDFTSFFRDPLGSPAPDEWKQAYQERLGQEAPSPDREARTKRVNPLFVLRNYIAQEVIDDVEAGGTRLLNDWLRVLEDPFGEHPGFGHYARPTPPDRRNLIVSCSS